MATNEILPFATSNIGTNLLTQAEYTADEQRTIGHQPGIARSKLANKAMRQASLMAAGLAEFIADYQANNVTDSLTPQQVADYLLVAIQSQIPSGIITMWSGLIVNIPTGWFLCNGSNGTPDLRNRFIVGAGSTYSEGNTGGSANATLPSHTHTAISTVTDPGHNHDFFNDAGSAQFSTTVQPYVLLERATVDQPTTTETTGITVATTIASTGSSPTNANLPPYYALAYIMKG
jgi:hypothetical protein